VPRRLLLITTVVIAAFIVATVWAQNNDDPGGSDDSGFPAGRRVMSSEEYQKDVQTRWSTLQQQLQRLQAILSKSPSREIRDSATPLSNEISQLFNRWRELAPPPGLEGFDKSLMLLVQKSTWVSSIVAWPCCADVNGTNGYPEAVASLNRLQAEVVAKSQPVGGLKPLRDNWFCTGTPSAQIPAWKRQSLQQYAGDAAMEPLSASASYVGLCRVRDDIAKLRKEIEVQLSRGSKVDWVHYYRTLWYSWVDARTSTGWNEDARQLAERLTVVQFDAWCCFEQTGEKETPESQQASKLLTELMACLLAPSLSQ